MLKKLLLSMFACLMFFITVVTFAESNDDTVTEIEDDKTPEAAKKRNYISYYAGASILLFISGMIMMNQKARGGVAISNLS